MFSKLSVIVLLLFKIKLYSFHFNTLKKNFEHQKIKQKKNVFSQKEYLMSSKSLIQNLPILTFFFIF